MSANAVQSQSTARRYSKFLGRKSTGPNTLFPKDVFGVLEDLLAPSETGRPETYNYEGSVRYSTWTAVIKECVLADGKYVFTGRTVQWSWPGYRDDDDPTSSALGVNIIQEGASIDDLFGVVAHYKRDEKSRRSTVTLVRQQ